MQKKKDNLYIEKGIKKVLSKVLNIAQKQIGEQSSMETLENWDSQMHIAIIGDLENFFNIEFEEEEYPQLTEYYKIRNFILKKIK